MKKDPNFTEIYNFYLLGVLVLGSSVPIPLAVNGGVSATADSIHLPLREVVVHHVYVPAPAPRHTLHQRLTEVVERNRHLHSRVRQVLIVVAQKHHLVVVGKVAVRDRDSCGPHYSVDQAVGAVGERAMVDPDFASAKEGDAVAVRFSAPPNVGGAGGDVSVTRGFAVVDVDVVYDDVGDVLERYAAAAGDVDVEAPTVNGLEAVDDELAFELDGHVGGEDDPEGLCLDHGVAERARDWVGWVPIGRVGDDVDLASFASHGVLAEPYAAIGELLPVSGPVRVAAPAIVDWVAD